MKKIIIISSIIFVVALGVYIFMNSRKAQTTITQKGTNTFSETNPLSVSFMRKQSYPGSDLVIEQTLPSGSNYSQYIASYKSEGLKIYGLLTVPNGTKPKDGWPVVIFNHGYIPPKEYRTTERYGAYVDAFARNGYIVFKSDYRGNGNSEGEAMGAYYSPGYTIDVLNALASVKKYKDANPNKVGMWGHSMGGFITVRSLEIDSSIKAAVIWGGVIGSYEDIMFNWRRGSTSEWHPAPSERARLNQHVQEIITHIGSPSADSPFWQSIDSFYNVQFINAPVQLHHGLSDEEVPVEFSQNFYSQMKKNNKTIELYEYPGSDHNISQSFSLAMDRSVAFFDKYLKE